MEPKCNISYLSLSISLYMCFCLSMLFIMSTCCCLVCFCLFMLFIMCTHRHWNHYISLKNLSFRPHSTICIRETRETTSAALPVCFRFVYAVYCFYLLLSCIFFVCLCCLLYQPVVLHALALYALTCNLLCTIVFMYNITTWSILSLLKII